MVDQRESHHMIQYISAWRFLSRDSIFLDILNDPYTLRKMTFGLTSSDTQISLHFFLIIKWFNVSLLATAISPGRGSLRLHREISYENGCNISTIAHKDCFSAISIIVIPMNLHLQNGIYWAVQQSKNYQTKQILFICLLKWI